MMGYQMFQRYGSGTGRHAMTPAKCLQAACLLLCITASQFGLAQEAGKHGLDYTYAPGSPTYWRNTHSTRPGNFVFRRDPNVWVYTPEVAQRVGMPLEWASAELKGVAAAAFRMERDGAEEDCGWGGNPKACKPLVRCVLELYFDRQAHPLPWAPNRMVADFYWQDVSTAYHFLPANGFEPTPNGDRSRGSEKSKNYPSLGARQPFADPQTGEELFWNTRVTAYDKEIHGRYAFVRLELGCQGLIGSEPNANRTFRLETQRSRDARNGQNTIQSTADANVLHEVLLPASWDRRVAVQRRTNRQHDEDFYKGIWNNLNSGDKK